MLFTVLLCCIPFAISQLMVPVDLSHYYDETTLAWADSTPFHFTKVSTSAPDQDWYAINEIETAEHAGTHLDAPYHFYQSGWKVGDIPLERFFGNAIYLNLRDKANTDPDYQVTADDLEAWEAKNGVIPEGAVVLLDFDWTHKYSNGEAYFGTDSLNDSSTFHFPGLSAAAAEWLVETDRVYGVGTDTASIDPGQNEDFPAHRILAKHGIFILEHMSLPATNLPPSGYRVLALPMKIRNGTGAPCRVLAIP